MTVSHAGDSFRTVMRCVNRQPLVLFAALPVNNGSAAPKNVSTPELRNQDTTREIKAATSCSQRHLSNHHACARACRCSAKLAFDPETGSPQPNNTRAGTLADAALPWTSAAHMRTRWNEVYRRRQPVGRPKMPLAPLRTLLNLLEYARLPVMAGLVPAIPVFLIEMPLRRG